MTTYRCDPNPDPKKRAEPVSESSVRMSGSWTFHAYKRSHDGKNNVIFHYDGFDVVKRGKSINYKYVFHGERGFYWHPNNDKLCYFGNVSDSEERRLPVMLLELNKCSSDQDGGKPPHSILYEAPKGHVPYGLEWSPSGEALYVLERYREDFIVHSRIVRVTLDKKVTQVARIQHSIDFFMPPVSRFESGEGPSSQKYWIVFGHRTGLYLCTPDGKKRPRRVAKLPATGLHNIEWNPKKSQLVLFFKHGSIGADRKRYQGVYLVHLDRIGREKKGEVLEQLYGDTDIHTLWYSPQGKYVCWASTDALYYRRPSDPPEKTVKVVPVWDDLELEMKGVTWHENERMLAMTAGNHVFVIDDVSAPEPKPRRIATFGRDVTHFTAEPIWLGNQVYLTVFQDLTREERTKKSNKPSFARPKDLEKKYGKGKGR